MGSMGLTLHLRLCLVVVCRVVTHYRICSHTCLPLLSSLPRCPTAHADQIQAAPSTTASRLRLFMLRAFVRAYPWLHAGCQAVHFGYHAAYLLGPSPVHCPQLQLQGVCMARVSAQDMVREGDWRKGEGGRGGRGNAERSEGGVEKEGGGEQGRGRAGGKREEGRHHERARI